MPGIPDLAAQVNALAGRVSDLETGLSGHKTRLETALSALTSAAANGASVPQLIDLTTELATQVNATLNVLKAWSDGEVSQTYLDNLLADLGA